MGGGRKVLGVRVICCSWDPIGEGKDSEDYKKPKKKQPTGGEEERVTPMIGIDLYLHLRD